MEQIFCWILLGIIAIEQVMDAMTTVEGIKRKGVVEKNKILAKVFDALGVIPGMVVVKGSFLLILANILVYFPSTVYTIALAIIAALYAAVIANNYRRL